jgi:hypothetical protein
LEEGEDRAASKERDTSKIIVPMRAMSAPITTRERAAAAKHGKVMFTESLKNAYDEDESYEYQSTSEDCEYAEDESYEL